MSEAPPRRLDRRSFLAAAGTGTAVALAGCTGGSDSTAKLTDAFFRVTQGGTIRFALVYDEEPDADALNPETTLNVEADRATVVHDDGVSLDWYANAMSSQVEVEDRAGADAIGQFQGEAPSDAEIFPDLNKVLKGKIEQGALPPAQRDDQDRGRFEGGATQFPSIKYSKDEVTSQERRVHVQFTDGYVYHFPRDLDGENPYPRDARYDIGAGTRTVHNINGGDGDGPDRTADFSNVDQIPTVYTDDQHLVGAFDHKTHPLLGALQTLAQRRTAAFTRIASTISTNTVEDYVSRVREQTQTAVADIVTTVGPTPVTVENEIQTSFDVTDNVVRKNVPAIAVQLAKGASMSGRVAAKIGGAATHTWDLYKTAKSLDDAVGELREWGDTIGDNPAEKINQSAWSSNLNFDGACGDRSGPQCIDRGSEKIDIVEASTPEALVALSDFQARLGVNALGSGKGIRKEAEAYVETLQEVQYQCEWLGTTLEAMTENAQNIDEDLLAAAQDAERFYERVAGGEGDSLLDMEVGMVAQVVDDFSTADCETIRESWGDGTYEPEWQVADNSASSFDVEVVTTNGFDGSALAISDGSGGQGGRIEWSRSLGGWDGPWTISGVFDVPEFDSLGGSQAHWFEFVPASGTDNLLVQIGLQNGDQPTFRILGSLVSDAGDASTTFPKQGSGPYAYRITHDGTGGYWCRLTPLNQGEAQYISTQGRAPNGRGKASLGLDSQGTTATVNHYEFRRRCSVDRPQGVGRPK